MAFRYILENIYKINGPILECRHYQFYVDFMRMANGGGNLNEEYIGWHKNLFVIIYHKLVV